MPTLANTRLLFFVDDVYEDLELWYPLLRMREAGATAVVAGPEAGQNIRASMAIPVWPRPPFARSRPTTFEGVVIPGGFMPDKLRRDAHVLELVRRFDASGKLVAAICHGGWVPISAGVYRGVR